MGKHNEYSKVKVQNNENSNVVLRGLIHSKSEEDFTIEIQEYNDECGDVIKYDNVGNVDKWIKTLSFKDWTIVAKIVEIN